MTATHCPYCALQCAMSVAPADPGVTPTVTPLEFPTNRGRLCQKGWTSAEVLTTPDRLTSPLVRRDAELVPTDWGVLYGAAQAQGEPVYYATENPADTAMIVSTMR